MAYEIGRAPGAFQARYGTLPNNYLADFGGATAASSTTSLSGISSAFGGVAGIGNAFAGFGKSLQLKQKAKALKSQAADNRRNAINAIIYGQGTGEDIQIEAGFLSDQLRSNQTASGLALSSPSLVATRSLPASFALEQTKKILEDSYARSDEYTYQALIQEAQARAARKAGQLQGFLTIAAVAAAPFTGGASLTYLPVASAALVPQS